MLAQLQNPRLSDLGMEVSFPVETVEQMAKEGFDPLYGARPLRRTIQARVEDPLAEEMLAGNLKPGVPVECVFREGKLQLQSPAEAVMI